MKGSTQNYTYAQHIDHSIFVFFYSRKNPKYNVVGRSSDSSLAATAFPPISSSGIVDSRAFFENYSYGYSSRFSLDSLFILVYRHYVQLEPNTERR